MIVPRSPKVYQISEEHMKNQKAGQKAIKRLRRDLSVEKQREKDMA